MRRGLIALCLLLLTGCYLSGDLPPTLPILSTPEPPTAAPTLPAAYLHDAAETMRGICFEAAYDAAGQVFVLRSSGDYIAFYDLADHSELCSRPVERVPFDFCNGSMLAGLWSAGTGCTAHHDIQSVSRDDAARSITIDVQFSTDGDCPYELVRPFWLALDGVPDYAIDIRVTSATD